MITCDFSKRKNESLSHYLYLQIKKQITDGTLKANTKLPSKRSLAVHLGISVITVQNTYQNLIDEGYIYSIEKTGFFVEQLDLSNLPVNNTVRPEEKKLTKPQNTFTADFTQNAIGYEKFPIKIWTKISKDVLKYSSEELLKTQPAFGNEKLRESIANHLKKFRNMNVSPDQIVIGAGTELLYNFIVLLLGQDKIYAVENPGYKKTKSVIELLGAKCIPVDMDKSGLLIEELKKNKIDVVHVTPSHHFPSGIVMPVKRRLELLDWASGNDNRYIIEDDYDSEFRFTGRPLEPLFNSDRESKIIYLNTFSKTLSPSFRVSYMVLPEKLVPVFKTRISAYSCTVGAIEQCTIAEFISEEYFEKHIIRMKNYYRSIRNSFIQALDSSSIKDKIEISEENAGLHFLLHFKTEKSSASIKKALEEKGIKVNLLEDYYYSASGLQNTFVINYSGISRELIPVIVKKFEEVI